MQNGRVADIKLILALFVARIDWKDPLVARGRVHGYGTGFELQLAMLALVIGAQYMRVTGGSGLRRRWRLGRGRESGPFARGRGGRRRLELYRLSLWWHRLL